MLIPYPGGGYTVCPLHGPGNSHTECPVCCPGGGNSSGGLHVWRLCSIIALNPHVVGVTINCIFKADSAYFSSRIVSAPHNNYVLKVESLTSQVIERLRK